jgi:hypothetical protein
VPEEPFETFQAYPEGVDGEEFTRAITAVIGRLRDEAVAAVVDTIGPFYGERTPEAVDKAVVAAAGCLAAAAGCLMEERLGEEAAVENLRRLLERVAASAAAGSAQRH